MSTTTDATQDSAALYLRQQHRRTRVRIIGFIVGALATVALYTLLQPSPCDRLAHDICEDIGLGVQECEPFTQVFEHLEVPQQECATTLDDLEALDEATPPFMRSRVRVRVIDTLLRPYMNEIQLANWERSMGRNVSGVQADTPDAAPEGP